MSTSKKIGIAVIVAIIVFSGIQVVEQISDSKVDVFVSTAKAKVGRPLTPVSVAGVARRTSRRN